MTQEVHPSRASQSPLQQGFTQHHIRCSYALSRFSSPECLPAYPVPSWTFPLGCPLGTLKPPSVSRGDPLLPLFLLIVNDTNFHPAAHTRALGHQVLAILPPECSQFHPQSSILTSALCFFVQATSLMSTVS